MKDLSPKYLIADSGYKTPTIAHFLLSQDITPVFPYTRPHGKKGMLIPKEFIYDVYLCPENKSLHYSTTNREGYREYKSNPTLCQSCPLLSVCTQSKSHQKIITLHLWKDTLEICEEIRDQRGMKERLNACSEQLKNITICVIRD